MNIRKILEDFGFEFGSKDELGKKKLKKLLSKFAKRRREIKKLISKGDIDKKTKTDLEETLEIISKLRKQKITELRSLIKKIQKKGKK